MEKVKRYGLWGFFPFNRVHVTVGEPVEFADLTARVRTMRERRAEEALYKDMMARVEEKMRETRDKNARERHADAA